jgi:branched-chain amino acid transport system ATP-binding protein
LGTSPGAPIIGFDRVSAGYSPTLTILHELTLDARAGEITLLIGPNGAGKSTVLKTLFGLLRPSAGEIRFEGAAVGGSSCRQMLDRGIAFVPQGRNLFPSLSVLHNLELGGITLGSRKLLDERIEEVLQRFPRIRERLGNQASTLSGGEQKQLEIGRALLLRPRVMLIDEPSIGLSPRLVQETFGILQDLRAKGVTILMVEQNAKRALEVSDFGVVLELGRTRMTGEARTILADPRVGQLFLGGGLVTDST